MKLRVVTREGERLDFELDPDQPAIRLEFRVFGLDPEFPMSFWLSDLQSLEVSEHPEPITQAPAAQYKEVEIDNSVYGLLDGKPVRVGKPRTFTTRVLDTAKPKTPAKKEAAKKKAAS